MYVYVKNIITGKYDVGFFSPDGVWNKITNVGYDNQSYAAQKVHYLNGGDITDKWTNLMMRFLDWEV